jgi:hypothetical protein
MWELSHIEDFLKPQEASTDGEGKTSEFQGLRSGNLEV